MLEPNYKCVFVNFYNLNSNDNQLLLSPVQE